LQHVAILNAGHTSQLFKRLFRGYRLGLAQPGELSAPRYANAQHADLD
jgi:hypothetical protein